MLLFFSVGCWLFGVEVERFDCIQQVEAWIQTRCITLLLQNDPSPQSRYDIAPMYPTLYVHMIYHPFIR